jgi:hypothetical protein
MTSRPTSRTPSRDWIAPTRSRRLASWIDRFTFGILTYTNLSTMKFSPVGQKYSQTLVCKPLEYTEECRSEGC